MFCTDLNSYDSYESINTTYFSYMLNVPWLLDWYTFNDFIFWWISQKISQDDLKAKEKFRSVSRNNFFLVLFFKCEITTASVLKVFSWLYNNNLRSSDFDFFFSFNQLTCTKHSSTGCYDYSWMLTYYQSLYFFWPIETTVHMHSSNEVNQLVMPYSFS